MQSHSMAVLVGKITGNLRAIAVRQPLSATKVAVSALSAREPRSPSRIRIRRAMQTETAPKIRA